MFKFVYVNAQSGDIELNLTSYLNVFHLNISFDRIKKVKMQVA